MRFDDIRLDEDVPVGSHTFTLSAILDYARRFDPQPFHVDEAAAADGPYGGIIASGWHTAAAWMRLTVDHAAREGRVAGISPGLDAIEWLKPVRPGDTIAFTNRVVTKRRLSSRQGWAIVRTESVGTDQAGAVVFRMRGPVFFQIDD
jgi:acyl dehydratase